MWHGGREETEKERHRRRQGRDRVSKLVFYALSTITVIPGQWGETERNRERDGQWEETETNRETDGQRGETETNRERDGQRGETETNRERDGQRGETDKITF